MKTHKIGVAIVGLGYWGPNLVRNFNKLSDIKLEYGCDLLESNIKRAKHDFPQIKYTTNYNEILQDPYVQAISIATPLSTHFDLAKKALLSDKHIIVEKPFTKTTDEAKELIKLAKKKKLKVMVGHTFVYSEAVKKLKTLIDAEKLGKLLYYDSTRINLGQLRKDADVIWDLAVHDFAILNYLIKDRPIIIKTVSSSPLRNKSDELAHIFITYKNGFTAHIYVSWLSPIKIRTILIGGKKKMVLYDDIQPSEKIRIYDKGITIPNEDVTPFNPLYRSGDILIPKIKSNEALFNELSHFILCIKNDIKPITDGYDGLKVISMLEASDASMKTGKEIQIEF